MPPYNVIVSAPDFSGASGAVVLYDIFDSAGNYVDYSFLLIVPTASMSFDDIKPLVATNIAAYFTAQGYTLGNIVWWYNAGPSTLAATVSQTSTAAPSATLLRNNTGVTFTWARTGVGVYTLTASAAIFNTSGRTGVLMTPPQNLNGSFKAVVTSTTVITITTAVQSLAVLGLLGFTASPTDAMLSSTFIEVVTYP